MSVVVCFWETLGYIHSTFVHDNLSLEITLKWCLKTVSRRWIIYAVWLTSFLHKVNVSSVGMIGPTRSQIVPATNNRLSVFIKRASIALAVKWLCALGDVQSRRTCWCYISSRYVSWCTTRRHSASNLGLVCDSLSKWVSIAEYPFLSVWRIGGPT